MHVHFVEVLHALSGRVMGAEVPEQEEVPIYRRLLAAIPKVQGRGAVENGSVATGGREVCVKSSTVANERERGLCKGQYCSDRGDKGLCEIVATGGREVYVKSSTVAKEEEGLRGV